MLHRKIKEAIREEEIYRHEVREELKIPKENESRLFKFLDTQHGLFIASAVILPFAIWLFTVLQSTYADDSAKRKLISSIDHEISFRVSQLSEDLQTKNPDLVISNLDTVNGFPQFEGFKTRALMVRLEALVPDTDKLEIVLARKALREKDIKNLVSRLRVRKWLN